MKQSRSFALVLMGAILSSGIVACAKIESAPSSSEQGQVGKTFNQSLTEVLTPYEFTAEEISTIESSSLKNKTSLDEIKSVVADVVAAAQCKETEPHDCTEALNHNMHQEISVALIDRLSQNDQKMIVSLLTENGYSEEDVQKFQNFQNFGESLRMSLDEVLEAINGVDAASKTNEIVRQRIEAAQNEKLQNFLHPKKAEIRNPADSI